MFPIINASTLRNFIFDKKGNVFIRKVWWQETFCRRKRFVAVNIWWQVTFGGMKRFVAGNICWQETLGVGKLFVGNIQ